MRKKIAKTPIHNRTDFIIKRLEKERDERIFLTTKEREFLIELLLDIADNRDLFVVQLINKL